jgi:hypothetical protein
MTEGDAKRHHDKDQEVASECHERKETPLSGQSFYAVNILLCNLNEAEEINCNAGSYSGHCEVQWLK